MVSKKRMAQAVEYNKVVTIRSFTIKLTFRDCLIYVYIPFLVIRKIKSIFELMHRNICYDILEKQLNWVL